MRKRLPVIIVIAVTAIAIYAVGTAVAAQVSVTIIGGPFDLSPSSGNTGLGDITLNGNSQTTTGTLGTFVVRDARGTGVGWHVTVSATDFQKIGDPSKTIPASGFSVPDVPTVTTLTGNGGAVGYAVANLGTGGTIVNATDPNGRGRTQVNANLSLVVPAETYIGTYDSTITETLITGP